MSKPRSRPPVSGSRPVRRSLVELTAAAASAADEGPLPSIEPATAIGRIPSPDPVHAAGSNAREIRDHNPAESIAEMAAKTAKDYQARVLEDMKDTMSAALNYASALAITPMPAEPAADEAKTGRIASSEKDVLTAFGAAADYRDEVFELMKTNMRASLEYAQQLVNVSTPSQFVALSSTHARKQFESIIKQTSELRSLTQNLAKSGAKPPR